MTAINLDDGRCLIQESGRSVSKRRKERLIVRNRGMVSERAVLSRASPS